MHVTNKGRVLSLALAAVFAAGSLLALDIDKLPPDNWTVPSARAGIRTTMTDATSPRPFIGLVPCRIVDTRGNGAPIQGGAFSANQIRTWALSGKCGIPTGADAVSLNLTVTGTGAHPFGFATLWPTGQAQPTASNINWSAAGQTIANAVIVPLGTSGSVNVIAGNAGTDFVLDVNGYFSDVLGTPSNYFQLTTNSGGYTAFLQNLSTTCGGACGIYQSVGSGIAGYFTNSNATAATSQRGLQGVIVATGTGNTGMLGEADGTTGVTYGVEGLNFSNASGAAGVYGVIGNPAFSSTVLNITAGVTGIGGPTGGGVQAGVMGAGTSRGVTGYQCNPGCGSGGIVGASATAGLHSFGDITAGGTKSFVEPHPSDASRQIVYIALEGGEAGTYFRGRGRFVRGQAVISVPEDFRLVTESEGLTVQITPMGRMAQVGVVNADLNSISAESSRDVEFSYLVHGFRRGFTDRQPIQDNTIFVPSSPNAIMDKWPEKIQKTLIDVGIYNPDGTVNMKTAEQMGWAKAWQDQAAAAAATAAAASSAAAAQRPR
jgi:hypothetical protein